jgi:nicotinate-nucleotide adenylyltransferase
VRRGIYPGSFNPPTIAHLAIAQAARDHAALDQLDLVLSGVALGKGIVRPSVEHRLGVLEELRRSRPWLGAYATERQLLVDLAEGYDLLVVGADKWAQLQDPAWYGGSADRRDDALARLPPVLVVPRPPFPLPEHPGAQPLPIPQELAGVSSSEVRAGRRSWMVPEAAAFDEVSGAWSDPQRYELWATSRPGASGAPG